MAGQPKNTQNVWQKNNMPALEFCSLQRASELLGCSTTDLLHLARIGAVEICLQLQKFESCLITTSDQQEILDWEENFPVYLRITHTNKSPLSIFSIKAEFKIDDANEAILCRTYENSDIPNLKRPVLLISGLWALSISSLPNGFFRALGNNEGVDVKISNLVFKEADTPSNKDGILSDDCAIIVKPRRDRLYEDDLLVQCDDSPLAKICVADIFMTRQQIENVHNSIGKVLPSFINGQVTQEEPGEWEREKPARGTTKQADLIVALLKAIGLTDDDLKGSIGELIRKAESKVGTLPFPDDQKSTAEWLRKGGVNR